MNEKLLSIPTRRTHVGKHLVLDAWRISSDLLDDPEFLRTSLKQAVESCGATLINLCVHQFSPYGVTATATLAESHMAVHTWPEHGYLGADLFFCGSGQPERALETLVDLYHPKDVKIRRLNRGVDPAAEADDILNRTEESA
jgi:S-adenosylmethionine decarboxylase